MGASRGVGRGIAAALADAGYRVYATARTIAHAKLPAGVIRLRCDHTHDEQMAAVFSRIAIESGTLDILVNSTWRGESGVHAAFVAPQHAARLMVRAGRGLIVNISYWAAVKYLNNEILGISKAANDRMTTDTAFDLKPNGVTVVSLYPGLVRTEEAMESRHFDWRNSESPEFTGRVIVALARDPELKQRSGEAFVVAALALEYGIEDIDGKQPRPITITAEDS